MGITLLEVVRAAERKLSNGMYLLLLWETIILEDSLSLIAFEVHNMSKIHLWNEKVVPKTKGPNNICIGGI